MIDRGRSLFRIAAAVFGTALLAACGSPETPAPAAAEPAPSDAGAALTQVFDSATAIDQPFDGASLADADAVVWFWAPWCTSCRAEAPEVNAIVERYGDRVHVVGVGGRGSLDEMRSFINDTGTSGLTHVADLDGSIWEAFGVYAQPAFAFIDDTGEIEVFVGGLDEDALAEQLDTLLA